MNILEKIIATKKKEIFIEKEIYSIKSLEKSSFFERKCYSLCKELKKSTTGIIAEFKRSSPSKGIINNKIPIKKVVKDYEKSGASGVSILTDKTYFNGKNKDLIIARKNILLPILRKDFIIDEYQIIVTKSIGADIILLIAEILSKKKLKEFTCLARKLNLEVLMEVHSEKELDKVNEHINLIGINNRDLKTFSVDIKNSVQLVKKIPNYFIKISESGIYNTKKINFLKKIGFKGFLIGENFMKSENPGKSCKEFIKNLNFN